MVLQADHRLRVHRAPRTPGAGGDSGSRPTVTNQLHLRSSSSNAATVAAAAAVALVVAVVTCASLCAVATVGGGALVGGGLRPSGPKPRLQPQQVWHSVETRQLDALLALVDEPHWQLAQGDDGSGSGGGDVDAPANDGTNTYGADHDASVDLDMWQCAHRPTSWPSLPRVVYNRILKTGSMSFAKYLRDMCFRPRHNCTYVNERGVDFFRIKEMADEQHARVAAGIAHANFNASVFPLRVKLMGLNTTDEQGNAAPLATTVFDSHMPFMDFSQWGLPQPAFVNLVREPLRRVASHYSYNAKTVKPFRKHHWPCTWNLTLDECLDVKRDGSCPQETYSCQPGNSMTAFFCGVAPECGDPASREALAMALHNLQYVFAAVGVLEDMPLTIELFAKQLGGAIDVKHRFERWARLDKLKINAQKKGRTSRTLQTLSPKNLAQVRRDNANDVILYARAKQLLLLRTQRCGIEPEQASQQLKQAKEAAANETVAERADEPTAEVVH